MIDHAALLPQLQPLPLAHRLRNRFWRTYPASRETNSAATESGADGKPTSDPSNK
jgi:hypothetical protein